MFIWPFGISVEYDWKLATHFFAADCILPFFVLVFIFSFLGLLLKKDRTNLIGFGALWWFITLAPRSSIIPSSELLTDYKTYLASVGLLFILACSIVNLFTKITPRLSAVVPFLTQAHLQHAMIFLLAFHFGFMTYNRNKVWRSGEEFWTNVIENAPGKARAYNNLGVAISEKGNLQDSIPLYKKAINMDRNYPDPWNNLAVAYSMTGKMGLAIQTLKQAIKIHPYYPEAYNNLASFYINQKELDKAEKVLQVAIQMRPHYGKAFYNLGKVSLERGNNDAALEYFKTACTRADLDNEPGFQVYANAAINMKKYDDAIFALQNLLKFNPTSPDYNHKLANVYLMNKNYQEASSIYRRFLQMQPNNGQALYHLGECYLHMGQPDFALDQYKQAQQCNFNVPQVPLRIVACLEQLGNLDQAKVILESFIKNDAIPETYRSAAQTSLAKLNDFQKTKTA